MTELPESLYPPGYRDPPWDGSAAQFRDRVLPARAAAIGRTLNGVTGLPDGLRLEFGGVGVEPEPWMVPHLEMALQGGTWVPVEQARAAVERDVCAAFGVKPWQVGVGRAPWRVRVWRKVSFARQRARRRIEREDAEAAPPDALGALGVALESAGF